jgi:signal transduction histidine kinase
MGLLAHEVRTPLAPLRNAAMALDRLHDGDPRIAWAHAVIRRQVDAIADLVQNFVEISALSSDHKQPSGKASLQGACRRALDDAYVLALQHDIRIIVAPPLRDTTVEFDAPTLERVVGIMISHAIKQSIPGGEIGLSTRLTTGAAVVEVREHDRGMTESECHSLFDLYDLAFESPDSLHSVRVGLYLAKRLVERNGGVLHCCSSGLGRGSSLILHAPLAPD